MHVLLVAASNIEIAGIIQHIEKHGRKLNFFEYHYLGHTIYPLVTGIGSMKTAFGISRYVINKSFDIAFNIGIGGALPGTFALGQVVQVINDRFADLGVEEKDQSFTDIFELGLEKENTFPFAAGSIVNHSYDKVNLATARGITVNKVHGSIASISAIKNKYKFEVESMEGAAFLYACKMLDIKGYQIRAISNYIENRNRENWKVEEALNHLTETTINILDTLQVA
jgi:futalosine hydrolase